jgi:endonuclease YncB( thermonuclease family)
MKKLLLFIILISTLTFAQEFKITKIIDNNIFQLENGQLVKLAEVYVPSIKETNDAVSNLAIKINNWAYGLLVGNQFKLSFITNDSLPKIRIYRSLLLIDEDITKIYIQNGYAIFRGDTNSTKYIEYMDDQNTAQKNKKGIWSLKPEIISAMLNGKIIPKKLKTLYEWEYKSNQPGFTTASYIKSEMPYLPLLAVSFASFALAWDYFLQASDIQKTIDVFKTISPKGDYSDLESSKTRKTAVAITCLAAGIITTLFSLKEVRVKTDLQSLTLSYRF